MRFNSPEHLIAWRDTGRFPAIHDAIANMAVANMRGRHALLDLGCSYGLLGHRITMETGFEVEAVGIEADRGVIEAAEEACVRVKFYRMRVDRTTMPAVLDVIRENKVETLVARRVLPELFGQDLDAGRDFAAAIRGAGVREAFIEGRVAAPNAVNPLRTIADEVRLLAGSFREVRRAGAVSYLVAL